MYIAVLLTFAFVHKSLPVGNTRGMIGIKTDAFFPAGKIFTPFLFKTICNEVSSHQYFFHDDGLGLGLGLDILKPPTKN